MSAIKAYSGTQAGDPIRAVEAMIQITEIPNPPRHLVLGEMGLNTVTAKLKQRLAEIDAWRDAGLATDFPKG
jgi:hypothetical protein